MADRVLMIEFSAEGADARALYNKVNDLIGTDFDTGENVPDGLRMHLAAMPNAHTLVVTEIWESEEQQGAFMQSTLGPALSEAGAPAPSRMFWADAIGVYPAE